MPSFRRRSARPLQARQNVAVSEEAKEAAWFLHELQQGTFMHQVTLPFDIHSANSRANVDNGILRLRLPKAEISKPRQIKVTGGQRRDAVSAKSGQVTKEATRSS